MARPSGEKVIETKRVQMDMPPRSIERLKALQSKTEASSYAEVIKNALRLYEAIIEEVDAGNKLFVERDGKSAEYKIFSA